jgi:hypothetical protein
VLSCVHGTNHSFVGINHSSAVFCPYSCHCHCLMDNSIIVIHTHKGNINVSFYRLKKNSRLLSCLYVILAYILSLRTVKCYRALLSMRIMISSVIKYFVLNILKTLCIKYEWFGKDGAEYKLPISLYNE